MAVRTDGATSDGSHISRRAAIAGGAAAAGAVWVAPTVVSRDAAFALGSNPGVNAGTAVQSPGGSNLQIPLPTSGTNTFFLMVFADEGSTPALPSAFTGTGWNTTPIATLNSNGLLLGVYKSNAATVGAPSLTANSGNDEWTARVFGFNIPFNAATIGGNADIKSGSGSVTGIVKASAGASSTTWALIGASVTNATWSASPADYAGAVDTAFGPDVYLSYYSLAGDPPTTTLTGTGGGQQKGVLIGIG